MILINTLASLASFAMIFRLIEQMDSRTKKILSYTVSTLGGLAVISLASPFAWGLHSCVMCYQAIQMVLLAYITYRWRHGIPACLQHQ